MYQCQTCAVPLIEARTACVHRSSSEGLRETLERYAHLQRLVNGHYYSNAGRVREFASASMRCGRGQLGDV